MAQLHQKPRKREQRPAASAPTGRSFFRKSLMSWLMLLGAFGIGAALYGYTLGFAFQFDDESYLLRNPLLADWGSFFSAFDFHKVRQAITSHDLAEDVGTNFILRPFTYFTFYLNHLVAGGWSEAGCRLVNIALHCLNGFLVFKLMSHLLRFSPKSKDLGTSSTTFIPMVGAVLFMVHPVQVEAVTYITQRFTSQGTLFYLLTLLFYFQAGMAQNGRMAWLLRAGSVAALVMGLLSKEEVFTAPVMMLLLDRVIMETPWKTMLRRTLPHLACMLLIPALIMGLSWSDKGGHGVVEHAFCIACPAEMASYSFSYFFTEIRVVVKYLGLLFAPSRLNVDWDTQNSESLLEGWVLGCGAIILAIVAFAWLFYRRARGEARHALFFCSVLWYFVTISVSSSIIPLPDAMADHRMYLPSIGFLVALACIADLIRTEIFRNRRLAWAVPAAMALWAVGLSAATVVRNNVWRNGISLWADSTLKSPEKFRPWGNLGVCYGVKGDMENARICLEKAISLKLDYTMGYRNLGIILNGQNKYGEAAHMLQQGLQYCGDDTLMHYNLAVALCAMGRLNDGARELQNGLAKNPGHFLSHFSLGDIYANQGKYEAAMQEYTMANQLSPQDKRPLARIAQIQSKTSSLAGR